MEQAVANMSEAERKALANGQPPLPSGNSIPGPVMREWSKDVPNLHSTGIPDMIVSTAPIIFDMKWNYMVRPAGAEPFLTSDNPAIMANPSLPCRSLYGPGLAQKGIEVSLPLSPELALLAGWQMNQDGHYLQVPATSVDEINRRTMRHAETLISNEKPILERQIKRMKGLSGKSKK